MGRAGQFVELLTKAKGCQTDAMPEYARAPPIAESTTMKKPEKKEIRRRSFVDAKVLSLLAFLVHKSTNTDT